MDEALSMAFALATGIVLGTFFFGGLWWTVSKGVSSRRPVLWFFGSMLLRTSIVVTGFYFVLGDDWKRLLAGLLGFIVARIGVTRLSRPVQPQDQLMKEAGHAP